MAQPLNILAILQDGRLAFEAVLLAASWRHSGADEGTRLIFAEPQPGPRFRGDPRLKDDALRARLLDLGAEIVHFENHVFGSEYLNGNKIIGLTTLPKGAPFLFLDTDTLLLAPLTRFDATRPSASMLREDTWPKIELYGPGYTTIWASLYDRFGLDFEATLDLTQPDEHWARYLYFNAGWFCGPCPQRFADLYAHYASEIRRAPGPVLEGQELYPWLDQIALPLVIHALGGGRPTPDQAQMDGTLSNHYRVMALLYARAPDATVALLEEIAAEQKTKKLLRQHPPFQKAIYAGQGERARKLFDRENLPRREMDLRKRLKQKGLWMR